MQCVDCPEYRECRKQNDLRRKRHRCPKAKQQPTETPEVLKMARRMPGLNPYQEQVFCQIILEAYQKGRADRVAELEDELAAAMEYIETMKDCETCAHAPDLANCTAADHTCESCQAAGCVCKMCTRTGSKWEWRYKHVKE